MYIIRSMALLALLPLFFTACGLQYLGEDIKEYQGDYRDFRGIGEFFDCDEGINYYVAKSGIHTELAEKYAALGLSEKEDVYTRVEGYLTKELQMDGIDPITVFVPTKFISFDSTRGCQKDRRIGH